jgi:CheY-like chemotaxis protein
MERTRRQRRVLVVDDEPDLQTLIGQVLWDAGHEVEFAADGTVALERAALGGLDLIVLDLMLPDLDGHVVLRRLREGEAPAPVLVVSGRADFGSCARALREGAQGYLVKPFAVRDLLSACQMILAAEVPRGSDRRMAPRMPVAAGVRVLSPDGVLLTLGEMIDLSTSGAQVKLGAPLQPRSGVRLEVDSKAGLHLGVDGRIAWRGLAPRGFAHGLGFVDLTPEHEGRVRQFLELQP